MATRPRAAPRRAESLAPGSWVATPTAETMAALHLLRARVRARDRVRVPCYPRAGRLRSDSLVQQAHRVPDLRQ